MKSAILSYFETLTRGPRSVNKKNITVLRTPELLENIRCHKTDEYPVVSAEDESPVPPLACSFSRVKSSSHILALADENGSVVLYDTNKAGDNSLVSNWSAHNNAIFDVKWMGEESKLLTASGDQAVCLWDVSSKAKLLSFKGHTSSVRSVGFRPYDDAVFSSGSRDGHIRLWDVRCNIKEEKVSSVHVIRNAHTISQVNVAKKKKARLGSQVQDSQQSVTCVVFQDDNLLATGGAVDGCVKVWDIRKIKAENSQAVYTFPYSGTSKRIHGFSSMVFDSYYSRLFANCTDDVIYCYDCNTYNTQPVKVFRGHRNTSFYVKSALSPDNQFLLSGSSDEHACIWQVDQPNASPVLLKGHRSEISDVAWCKSDLFRLVTTSDDYTMRVWRYDPTAKIRKQKGLTDQMYNITGTAECTHRDIGISAPVTPTISPRTSLKRAASAPVQTEGPLQLTPKRPRVAVASTPSPSIKDWLKRSVSDSQSSTSCDISACKKPRLITQTVKERSSVKRSASEMERDDTASIDSLNADKRLRLDSNSNVRTEVRTPVCKRVLIQSDQNMDKDDRFSIIPMDRKQSPNKENKILKLEKNKFNSSSPKRNDTRVLKDTDTNSSPKRNDTRVLKDTDTNSSPEKRKDVGQEFYSPIRCRKLDGNIGQNVQSPTANLPNIVVDGPTCSPKQDLDSVNSKKKVDWLTKMRIQKFSSGSIIQTKSPGNKQCSRRLLDKLVSSVKVESDSDKSIQDPEQVGKPKPVSPIRGTKSITSFFSRPQNC